MEHKLSFLQDGYQLNDGYGSQAYSGYTAADGSRGQTEALQ